MYICHSICQIYLLICGSIYSRSRLIFLSIAINNKNPCIKCKSDLHIYPKRLSTWIVSILLLAIKGFVLKDLNIPFGTLPVLCLKFYPRHYLTIDKRYFKAMPRLTNFHPKSVANILHHIRLRCTKSILYRLSISLYRSYALNPYDRNKCKNNIDKIDFMIKANFCC